MTNIEDLRKEADEIKAGLEDLKNNLSTISEEDKQKKVEEFNKKIDETKKKIQTEIDSLSDKTDEESRRKKEEAEALLTSFNETTRLYSSIINPSETSGITQGTDQVQSIVENQKESKGFLEETKDIYTNAKNWIGDQWNDVWDKGKWKSEGGKNLLRTAGFALTGVGAVTLAYKGLKKLWNWAFGKKKNGEKKESKHEAKKKSSWWKKGLAALSVGTAGFLGYKNWDKIKGLFKKEKPLTVEESLDVAAGEINCGKIDENIYRQNFKGIEYDKGNHNIISYGEKTEIDENNKCLVGLETVNFKTNTELVHAANIVNCLKCNLKGKGGAKQAFSETKTGGDIAFYFSDKGVNEVISGSNTDFWGNLIGIAGAALGGALGYNKKDLKVGIGGALGLGVGGYMLGNAIDNNSSLGKCCSTIKEGENFSRFIAYLNKLQIGGESK